MTAIIFVRLLAVGSSADEYEMDAVMPLQGCSNEHPREPYENLIKPAIFAENSGKQADYDM